MVRFAQTPSGGCNFFAPILQADGSFSVRKTWLPKIWTLDLALCGHQMLTGVGALALPRHLPGGEDMT